MNFPGRQNSLLGVLEAHTWFPLDFVPFLFSDFALYQSFHVINLSYEYDYMLSNKESMNVVCGSYPGDSLFFFFLFEV